MKIEIPKLSLVTLIGTSGSGKSTFAKKHFSPTEIISSDFCRGLVSDDENSLDATSDAFDLADYIIEKRLKRGNLAVMDATNVQKASRKNLIQLAKKHHVLPVAIVINTPKHISAKRNEKRTDRKIPYRALHHQHNQLRRSFRELKKEGFKRVFILDTVEEIENVEIIRQKLWNDKSELTGPFDLIGDIHGCFSELRKLLEKLGYKVTQHQDRTRNFGYTVTPPKNRKAIFVGDLVDRGPASNEVLRLVMSMVKNETGLCVIGNHDAKLLKKLNGRDVQVRHGLAETLAQLEKEPPEFVEKVRQFLKGLISHYVLDEGKLVVAHAGLRAEMHGRASKAVRNFCMYGETTGETDEFGLPIRYNWAKEYKGQAMVVYGHTPVPTPEFLNNTVDIDTGCVFGGELTALRYPEREFVKIKAEKVWSEPTRPLNLPQHGEPQTLTAQQENDDLLHIEDVSGKRIISTRLRQNITVREENSIAALEVMSRFAINPKWLAYLPPTMSPSETSELPKFLEHPKEAFEYFKNNGVQKVICEEKHMGSRAVVVIGQNKQAILKTFGIQNEGIGTVYTRTGRAFFKEKDFEQAFLKRFQKALSAAGFWSNFKSQWAVFDCELMPWSAKAQALLKGQYAAVGASSEVALTKVVETLNEAKNRGLEINGLSEHFSEKLKKSKDFKKAYRQYCWSVESLDDYKLAPFHLLATEDKTYFDKDHLWHMNSIKTICEKDPNFLVATPFKLVDFEDENAEIEATNWWLEMTKKGGEGMVIKPLNFMEKNEKNLIQPALKCRGKEYLRIIYGLDYDEKNNLTSLKNRGLSRKRSLAIREFALGVEALERFVRKEPLRSVHECVFGILAMESEPVDPRL